MKTHETFKGTDCTNEVMQPLADCILPDGRTLPRNGFRGSELIFTAMLTIFHRNQKLKPINCLDVWLTVAGITVVDVSAILIDTSHSDSAISQMPAMELVVLG
jgi:hypothetical protein